MKKTAESFYHSALVAIITFMMVVFCADENASASGAASIPHDFSVIQMTPPSFPSTGAINIILPSGNLDEYDTLIAPAGFSFNYSGNTYTKFVVSTNGWIALCPNSVSQIPPTFQNALPINQLASNNTGYPIIAPLWDDLSTNVIGISFTGSALWIRWTIKWNKYNAAAAASLIYLKLDVTNSTITFNYQNNTTYVPSSPSASIGISSWISGDYYSVYPTSSNSAYVDSLVEDTIIGQGSSTSMRPYNCSYLFTPRQSSTAVNFIEDPTSIPLVFPTIASEEITVKYKLKTSTNVQINLINPQGQVIYTESVDALVGFNVFNKKIGDIAPGTYYISILATEPENRFRLASFIKN